MPLNISLSPESMKYTEINHVRNFCNYGDCKRKKRISLWAHLGFRIKFSFFFFCFQGTMQWQKDHRDHQLWNKTISDVSVACSNEKQEFYILLWKSNIHSELHRCQLSYICLSGESEVETNKTRLLKTFSWWCKRVCSNVTLKTATAFRRKGEGWEQYYEDRQTNRQAVTGGEREREREREREDRYFWSSFTYNLCWNPGKQALPPVKTMLLYRCGWRAKKKWNLVNPQGGETRKQFWQKKNARNQKKKC